MKKIVLHMMMLVMALMVSQATWADGKDKGNNDKEKPNTEHRGHGYGQRGKGVKDHHWAGATQRGMRKGFDKAKWDSLKAAHPNFGHKMDSLKAAHPNFGHKMDSLKAHRPHFGHRPMFGHHRFGMHSPFGFHRLAYHHGWNHHKQAEVVVNEEVKPNEIMEATAISEIGKETNAPTFDLNGRKTDAQNTKKGIVIKGGKKYMK